MLYMFKTHTSLPFIKLDKICMRCGRAELFATKWNVIIPLVYGNAATKLFAGVLQPIKSRRKKTLFVHESEQITTAIPTVRPMHGEKVTKMILKRKVRGCAANCRWYRCDLEGDIEQIEKRRRENNARVNSLIWNKATTIACEHDCLVAKAGKR